jgi:hypothetical protein
MPPRMLMGRGFARACRKLGLTDQALSVAVREIEGGLVDARLAGFLLKKRIGIDGRGKSGGLRTILAHRQADRVVFLYVFGKNERDNITEREQQALSDLGDEYMRLTVDRLNGLVTRGILLEVTCDDQTKD